MTTAFKVNCKNAILLCVNLAMDNGSHGNFRARGKEPDSRKTFAVASIEELDIRSMNVYSRYNSQHTTAETHVQHALFAGACTWRRHNSARARMASRGHVGVGIDTASTTPKPIFDGASRGRSQAKLQDGCRLARHWSGCRSRFGPRTRWSSRVCSFSTAVLNAARPRCVSVPRSRRRS